MGSDKQPCGTGCITPSVCHEHYCNRVVPQALAPDPDGAGCVTGGTSAAPLFIDTPLRAAMRRAFDYPNQSNLEALIALAQSEVRVVPASGPEEREAREQVTRKAFDYVYSGLAVDTDPDGPARTGAEYDAALDAYRASILASHPAVPASGERIVDAEPESPKIMEAANAVNEAARRMRWAPSELTERDHIFGRCVASVAWVASRRALASPAAAPRAETAFPMEWSEPDSALAKARFAYDEMVVRAEALRDRPGTEERKAALARKDRAFVTMLEAMALAPERTP